MDKKKKDIIEVIKELGMDHKSLEDILLKIPTTCSQSQEKNNK